MKRPSFQFYPGDWLHHAALRMCSVAARGLWADMICLAHQGDPYGHLKVNLRPILPENLGRIVGVSTEDVHRLLEELEQAGVFSRDADGCIFSPRMVRDEDVRNRRAAGGILGGNPALKKVGGKVNHPTTSPPTIGPTPSSSSSSSSSKGEAQPSAAHPPSGVVLTAGWTLPDEWRTWAKQERPDIDVDAVAKKFHVHNLAAGRTVSLASWQKWVLDERARPGVGMAKTKDWWETASAIRAKGDELGITSISDDDSRNRNVWVPYAAKVWIGAGDGPHWGDESDICRCAKAMRNGVAQSGVRDAMAGLHLTVGAEL